MTTTTNESVARDRKDAGFTLIELMVVVLVIGILLAIAVPTFLGARNRANDTVARTSLRNALVSANTVATDTGNSYWTLASGTWNAAMQTAEPSLTFVAGNGAMVANGRTVSVGVLSATNNLVTLPGQAAAAYTGWLVMMAQSASSANSCMAIFAGTTGQTVRVVVPTSEVATCNVDTLNTEIGNVNAALAWGTWATW